MSKPLENYIIRIKSSIDQFDNEGVIREEDRDHIELMTRGSFTKKNGSYYISYKETQTIGFEGCTTTIKIAEDGSRVALLRFGRANSQLLIERDRRNLCHYETEVGSLTLGVTGDGIDCKLTEKGGSAAFSFFAFAARCFFSCAAFFLGLAASFLAATAFGGLGLHALGSGGGHFSIKLGLFGLATGGLEGGLVLFLFLLQSFLTSTGFFSFTACGFGTFLGGAALLFLADAGFLGAAGLFSTGALLSLRTGAGFGGGLFLGGAAGLSGFGFSASSLLGEHLRILHEDALASHFDRNRTGAAGAVLLLDDALFLARDGDLALSRLRALDAQAVEQARLVGLAQFIRFARLVDARGSKLSQKRLGGHLEFLCEFAYRFAGHKFLSP